MTKPDFDELIDRDVGGSERARLQRVHELLVAAGPPEELPPQLASGPTLGMTLGRRRAGGERRRRVLLLAATVSILVLAFLFGYIAGNHSGTTADRTLHLAGTNAAPAALAALRILPSDTSGNWPMELTATGLPKLGPKEYYEVFLVRNGKIYAPCGGFVSTRGDGAVDVTLNAPYRLRGSDTWIVTKQRAHDRTAGTVVLRPT